MLKQANEHFKFQVLCFFQNFCQIHALRIVIGLLMSSFKSLEGK
jgi:hypothetical protein